MPAPDLGLADLLNPDWLKVLGPVLEKQPDAARYVGPGRPWTIPEPRQNTFRALNALPPSEWRVVIIGQDPYPRIESATGIAFFDGAIHKWTDPLSPSFRNIVKNLFISKKLMTATDKIDKFRSVCASSGIPTPPEWFMGTREQGVLWLNTSLTFSSTDQSELKKHTAFWRPVMVAILDELLRSRAAAHRGLVFVLWGGYAQKLRKEVELLNKKHGIEVVFVEANHPAVESFHDKNSFSEIDAALAKLEVEAVPKPSAAAVAAAPADAGSSSDVAAAAPSVEEHVGSKRKGSSKGSRVKKTK